LIYAWKSGLPKLSKIPLDGEKKKMKRTGATLLFAVLAVALLYRVTSGEPSPDWTIKLNVGDKSWTYNTEQLKAFPSKTKISARGVKKNPVIPLDKLLMRDTKLSLDRIVGVVIIGSEHVLFLEGDHLKQIPNLVLKMGDNHWSIHAENDEAWNALRSIWGRPRVEDVERISVFHSRL